MRYCHSARSHPEVVMHGSDNFGSMHKWEKKMVHKAVRRFYKNGKWLAAAMVDRGVLNTSN